MFYDRPETLPDALAILAAEPRTVLAGGTDLYPATDAPDLAGPILDITGLPELAGIAPAPTAASASAPAPRWAEIRDAALPPAFDALRQAAAEVGGRQIQAAGTIGGNLCNASPAADGVPPLLALDAEVELAAAAGRRRLPLAAFLRGVRRTARRPDEILAAIHIPAQPRSAAAPTFLKLGARRYLVISIAMVAARLDRRERPRFRRRARRRRLRPGRDPPARRRGRPPRPSRRRQPRRADRRRRRRRRAPPDRRHPRRRRLPRRGAAELLRRAVRDLAGGPA